LQPGVTLRFPPSVGIMVAGKLEARGKGPNDIRFTLHEDRVEAPENDTESGVVVPEESQAPVRLLGGRTTREGRLQVSILFLPFEIQEILLHNHNLTEPNLTTVALHSSPSP